MNFLLRATLEITHFGVSGKGIFSEGLSGKALGMALAKSTHTDQYKRFRAILVAERKSHGLTQVQVAERLGKPQSFVTKYELGERRLDVVEFLYIADVIGFDPNTVLALLRKDADERSGRSV